MRTTNAVPRKRRKNRLFQKPKATSAAAGDCSAPPRKTWCGPRRSPSAIAASRKREFRKLWIIRINAACRERGMRYSEFINGLHQGQDRTRPQEPVGDRDLRSSSVRRDRRPSQSRDRRLVYLGGTSVGWHALTQQRVSMRRVIHQSSGTYPRPERRGHGTPYPSYKAATVGRGPRRGYGVITRLAIQPQSGESP